MVENNLQYGGLDTDATALDEQPVAIQSSNQHQWRKKAVCSGIYGDQTDLSWCPERAQSRPIEKQICWEECPVRRECLTWAIVQNEKFCIYGGYNYGQRQGIWRRWRDANLLPDIQRSHPDQVEAFRVVAESFNSRLIDAPNNILPSDGDLARLEAELEAEG